MCCNSYLMLRGCIKSQRERKSALFARLFVVDFKRYLLLIAHEVHASIRTKIARFPLTPTFYTPS